MQLIGKFAVAAVVVCWVSLSQAISQDEEPPPTIVPAPELEIMVSPTSGGVPVDVVIDVVNAYHPFGAYEVSCGLLCDNSSNDIHVHPRYFDIDAEGSYRIPWHAEIYVTQPGKYTLHASLSFDYANAPEGGNWEYAPGAVTEVEVELNFGVNELVLPSPRPIQNEGYKTQYLWDCDIMQEPEMPICISTSYPMEGQVPLTVDVDLAGSFSPVGEDILGYRADMLPVDGIWPKQYYDDEEVDVKQEDFNDPKYKFEVTQTMTNILFSDGPHFRFEITEPGCYMQLSLIWDSAKNNDYSDFEYINALGPGQKAPVAKLSSIPPVVEFEEITLLQHIVDQGNDPASVLGREDELIRVMPRGAVALVLDASGCMDPDGRIEEYHWKISTDESTTRNSQGYLLRHFYSATTDTPKLTFYVDSKLWPANGVFVDLMVVDNDGFVGKTSLTVGVEQDMPFGTKAELPVMEPGTDTDRYMGWDENGDVYWWHWDENGNVVIDE